MGFFPQPEQGPVPIQATYFGAGDTLMVVQFDQPLQEGPLNPANWSGIVSDEARVPAGGVAASFDEVVWQTDPGGPKPGPDGVSYAASPPDVLGLDGTPAPAFADFPLTVLDADPAEWRARATGRRRRR